MRRVPRVLMPILAAAICLGCGDPADHPYDPAQAETPRGPLGKADAAGSCKSDSGNFCGGKSEGFCYCDEACSSHGDCCEDYYPVCNGSPSSGNQYISCEEAGDICNTSPAGAAVFRLYSEIMRTEGTINESYAYRLASFLEASSGRNEAVASFLTQVKNQPSSMVSDDAKTVLQAYLDGSPPNWVPLENEIYRVELGNMPSFVFDDEIYLVGEGSLSGSTNASSHSRGYAKKSSGVLRSAHGSKAPEYPGTSDEDILRLRTQSPGVALDTAAAIGGLDLGEFGFEYRAHHRFYNPSAQYWEGLCHSWSYGALDERLNSLVDVEGPASRRGIWIFGQWLSRADLGNWLMAVGDVLSIDDMVLADNFVTPKDVILGVAQWVMTSGSGLRADLFNEEENGRQEIWNHPIIAATMKVSEVPQSVAGAIHSHAQSDPDHRQPLPSEPYVKVVEIQAVWGNETSDSHEEAPALKTSNWNIYTVMEPDGRVVVGYLAHHLARAGILGLPVTHSDAVPDYFSFRKRELINAVFEDEPNEVLSNAGSGEGPQAAFTSPHEGTIYRFFIGKVLAHGVPDARRAAFENDVADGMGAASLKQKYPGVANAYAPSQWDTEFADRLGSGKDFGAQWANH